MHNKESLWVKRLYRSIKPHHLANQIPNSLLGYDADGTPVVIQGGSGITISGGTISVGGGGGGTVTSVGLSAPTGLSVSGSPVTTSGTLALSYAAGYSIPTDLKQTDWDTAFGWGNHASAGYATTTYVDNLIDGLKWKQSVKVATTGNITLSGEQTIDGVLTSANRVLVWQQSDQTQNGVYISNSGAWTRAADASTGTELVSAAVNVEAGSTYADIEFVNTNNSINLGVDNITFVTRASTTNHNNLSGLQGGTTNEYYHLTAAEHGIATAPTLANISSFSNNASKSLYTMTSTIPVEFRTSGASPLLYLDETNVRVGIGVTTPSAQLSVTKDSIGVAQDNAYGIVLANNTPAAAGAQQMSPGIRWRGNGWKTNATADSQTVDFIADALPVQGAANSTGIWQLKSSINGAAYTDVFRVLNDGTITIGSNSTGPTIFGTTGAGTTTSAGLALGVRVRGGNSIANENGVTFSGALGAGATSGITNNFEINRSFVPTSGTAVYNHLYLSPTINQTGGANGITRGLYINPTLTSAADFRAIEMSNNSGFGVYQSGGSATNYFAGNVGIGTTVLTGISLSVSKTITGATAASGVLSGGTIQSDVTSVASAFQSSINTQAAAFNINSIRHFFAQQGTFGATSTVTAQSGFHVNSTLTGATNNYGFYGDIASATGRWNLYMNGTAPNYFAGNVGIGTTSPDRLFHVEVSDAATATVTYTSRESHITSGTATTGFGVGKEWELENGSGTNVVAATEEITWSDATNGSEDATYTLKLVRAGVLTTGMTINSAGLLTTTSDISAGGNLTAASSVFSGAGNTIGWSARSLMLSPSNGIIRLSNQGLTDFDRLQFGGTTSSFPSIKRNGTGLDIRLADDTGYAPVIAEIIDSRGYTIKGQRFQFNGGTTSNFGYLRSSVDGVFSLTNAAETDFGRLAFGGTTSSFPSLKRSGTGLVVRLADDSADAPITASNLLSGTYTPTITDIANIDSSSASPAQYMRVGNAVTVSGYIAIDPTAAASTEIAISLPIASNFANDYECAGMAVANGVTNGECAPIYGDSTNNRASMAWETSFTFGNRFYYTFTYQII